MSPVQIRVDPFNSFQKRWFIIRRLRHQKIIFTLLFILLLILVFFVIHPYLGTILAAMILSYTFYPVYKRLLGFLHYKWLASLFTCVLIMVIIVLPVIFLLSSLFTEVLDSYQFVVSTANQLNVSSSSFAQFLQEETGYVLNVQEIAQKGLQKALTVLRALFVTLPKRILHVFIMFFLMYYLFKDGDKLVSYLKRALSMKEKHHFEIMKQIDDVVYAVVYGHVTTSLVQGILGGFGFFLFGITSPLLWGMVMALFAFIPFLGTWLIWLPASLFLILQGILTPEVNSIFYGVGLFLYGLFVVSAIDNVIRPMIIGSRTKIHPAIIFIGVLGGLAMFGFIGIVIGPLLLALLRTFIDLYHRDVS